MNELSGWLSVIPMEKDNFDLTAQKFCNALAIQYKKPLFIFLHFVMVVVHLTSSLNHFLICKKDYLIT